MATVVGKTSTRIDELLADVVVLTYVENGRIYVKNRSGAVSDIGPHMPAHSHDDRYFTETESDTLFSRKITRGTLGSSVRIENLCNYEEAAGNLSGYLIIQTNVGFSNQMTRLHLTGHVYIPGNNEIDVVVSYYPYSAGPGVANASIVNKGSFHFSDVRILSRVSDGKIAIALLPYTTSNYWHYPKLWVDGIFGHSALSDAQAAGWSISRVGSLSGYTTQVIPTNNRPAGEDTGWLGVTLDPNVSQYSDGSAFKCKGGQTTIALELTVNINYIPGWGVVTIPSEFAPSKRVWLQATAGGTSHPFLVYPSGSVVYQGGGLTAGWSVLGTTTFPAK